MISKLYEIRPDRSGGEESGTSRATQLLRLLALSLMCLCVPFWAFDASSDEGLDEAIIRSCDSFRVPRSGVAPMRDGPAGPPMWSDVPSVSRLLETLLPPDLNGPSDRSAQFLRASRLCARSRIDKPVGVQQSCTMDLYCVRAGALHTDVLVAGRAFVFHSA